MLISEIILYKNKCWLHYLQNIDNEYATQDVHVILIFVSI